MFILVRIQMRRRIAAIAAMGRTEPVPAPSDRKRAAAEKAAAIDAARATQQQEDTALRELDGAKVHGAATSTLTLYPTWTLVASLKQFGARWTSKCDSHVDIC